MNTVLICTFIFVTLLSVCNLLAELARDLMMMQQNSYRPERYMRWLRSSGDTTSYSRLIGMCVLLISLVTFNNEIWSMALIGIFTAGSAITLIGKKYKKPLVWTNRVKRIYTTMLVLSAIIIAVVYICGAHTNIPRAIYFAAVASLGLYCVSHVVTLAAVYLLMPLEKAINRKYYNEAANILDSMPGLTVIGITGSYGKTSTKHYLQRILSEKFDVLMTPGSFNTTLGVIRTIREYMKPYTEVFICEMGAKQTGDIKEICDLVHPRIGIVTAVGPQHLESFKSIENVQRTKFELVDALPADGLAVVNDDFPFVASRKVDNVKCIRYGVSNCANAAYVATEVVYDESGTTFVIEGEGHSIKLHTKLVGECNVSNLIAAVIVALSLNVPEDKIRHAVEKIEQVEHRLNMKRTSGGVTIIDDAFNSNPTGSAMALDVLASMKSGRRYVITPGMIELGESQYELNRAFGAKIATCTDVAIVVGEYNREAIVEGINSVGDSNIKVHTAPTFTAAQQLLTSIIKSGDTVLYENDLPDTFK